MNRVGRADLLVILKRWGMEGLEQAARCMDFYLKPEVHNRDEHEKEAFTGALPTPSDEFKVEPIVKETGPLVHFWRAVEYRKKSETEVREDEPDWLKQVESFDVGEIKADRSRSIPSKTPLLPWAGMWPFLFGVLGYYCDTRTVDMERVVELAARARPLSPLPYLQRLTWAGTCQIILDMDDRLLPFWDDQTGLLQGIEKLRGGSGMEVLVFENGPEGLCRGWGKELGELRPYRLPAPGSPILVISDLGCLDTAEAAVKNIVVDETKQKLLRGGQGSPAGAAIEMSVEAIHRSKHRIPPMPCKCPPTQWGFYKKSPPSILKHSWLRFGRRLKRAGFLPVVLAPCPVRLWDMGLARYWRLFCWDRGQRLPRPGRKRFSGGSPHRGLPGKTQTGTELLLGLLSAAVRVEPALLRAVRMLLACWQADVGTEAAAWNHPHVHASPIAFAFDSEVIAYYRDLFKNNPPQLKARVIDCIKKYHAHHSPAVQAEEDLVAGELLDKKGREYEETQGHVFMKQVVKTQFDPRFIDRENLGKWLDRVSGRVHRGVWEKDDVFSAAWLNRNKEDWEKGRLILPPGMDIRKVAWVLGRRREPVEWVLRRKGGVFIVDRGGWISGETADGWDDRGSPAAKLTLGSSWLKVGTRGSDADQDYLLNAEARQPVEIPVPDRGQVILDTGYEQMVLDSFSMLDWADSIGCDRYGLYAEFGVKGVVQRMRFIVPGVFMMGSPENEPERYSDEKLHQVIITRGYWLADTACTQALWQAVMGKNPSRFKGAERPVETLSWKDCRTFIKKINGLKPGLELRLPTEAEWEYACRAGTTTTFWFGENITPDQVNYHGHYPYAGGKKGKYRGETVDVKSLPCNGWGLYQMHGNVWEWCSDWYGDYPTGSVIDPEGPPDGADRVGRGGSWIFDGRFVRSANRFRLEPSYRFDGTGFRLARGQQE